jgi:amino acid permease
VKLYLRNTSKRDQRSFVVFSVKETQFFSNFNEKISQFTLNQNLDFHLPTREFFSFDHWCVFQLKIKEMSDKGSYDDALMTTTLLSSEEGGGHDDVHNVYFHSHKDMEDRADRHSRLSMSSSFSAMNPRNSAKLTTFLLLNTMIGSGILNQPYVFKQSGILGGCLGFVLASVATWYGLVLLTAAGIHEDVLEYSGLAKRAFPRYGEKLVDIAIIVLTFGAQLGYILVVGTTISSLLESWGCDSIVCNEYFATIVSVGLFITPVCMFRHFGHLAYLSLFSIAAIVAVLLLVLIAGPIKHRVDHVSNDYDVFSALGTISSTGSIVFSLSCASANFQAFITTEKSAQNLTSWSWVTGTAVFSGTLMCAVMGIAGYLSFGNDTEGMILDNFPQHGYDFFKIMVVTHLILYIPVNFVIMRYSLVKMSAGIRSELLPFTTHTVITIALLVIVTAIVIALLAAGLASGEAFALILNITGGIGGKH